MNEENDKMESLYSWRIYTTSERMKKYQKTSHYFRSTVLIFTLITEKSDPLAVVGWMIF